MTAWASTVLTGFGLLFFIAGTVGLLRFPDTVCRVHALTKADNLGLGLIALGVLLQAPGPGAMLKVLLIWVLTIFAAGTMAQALARVALNAERSTED